MKITIAATFASLALSTLPLAAIAQQAPRSQGQWSIGAAAALIDSPYAGEGTRVRPFPLVSYEGERFFLRGISGGMHLYRNEGFRLDALLSARLYGFDIDDLGRRELAANGLDADLLSDRDDGIDAGFRAVYGATWGSLTLDALHDISDTHRGYELALDYRYTWLLDRTALTVNAGNSWMSANLSDYYFGTLDEEVARGVTAYRPGSVRIPRVGLTVMHPLGAKWQLMASAEYQFLPNDLQDSPLLEADRNGMGRLVLGLSRSF
ncbi:MipA/OmpV family protein [Pseudoxanthomonas composti]|uniref:MipA/OmpV family protein n=1 Tax=Pseudoxanthomonas composti TaxID=2137479 RepID=A0A4Q1K0Z7_9GAMM|nr:MipA/OmpV family protein [Pseudoxanthomonas composti]RXR08266.1 MipA/OmpV family protein [Pseudoxanthomonas composti]